MFDPATIFGGLALFGGGTGFLINQTNKLSRLEQKLDDHIITEVATFNGINNQLAEIKAQLPNGELVQILSEVQALRKALGK